MEVWVGGGGLVLGILLMGHDGAWHSSETGGSCRTSFDSLSIYPKPR